MNNFEKKVRDWKVENIYKKNLYKNEKYTAADNKDGYMVETGYIFIDEDNDNTIQFIDLIEFDGPTSKYEVKMLKRQFDDLSVIKQGGVLIFKFKGGIRSFSAIEDVARFKSDYGYRTDGKFVYLKWFKGEAILDVLDDLRDEKPTISHSYSFDDVEKLVEGVLSIGGISVGDFVNKYNEKIRKEFYSNLPF
jgi:hypothetical protein